VRELGSDDNSLMARAPGARLRGDETGRLPEASFLWLFPNLMLNIYPNNYSTNLIVPLGPERTLAIFEWYFRDVECTGVQEVVRQTVEFSDEVQIEDQYICEAV
jgi:choline monooxygenase